MIPNLEAGDGVSPPLPPPSLSLSLARSLNRRREQEAAINWREERKRERERERERQYLNSAARNAALRKISEYMLARIHVFSESVNFWPMRK